MRFKIAYFIFSLFIILPGLIFLVTFGLKFGIDFTGGVLLEYRFEKMLSSEDIKNLFLKDKIEVGQIIKSSQNTFIIRTKPLEQNQLSEIKQKLSEKFGQLEERRIESVGPVIGCELQQKATLALTLASIAIVLYIAFSFLEDEKI